MLNDKEKQAIFKLREIIDFDKKHRIETIYDKEVIELRNNIELVLDLVEKLQKENEELKNKVIKRDNDIIYLEETAEKEFLTKQEVKENYIPKDKIREVKKYLEYYLIGNLKYENCQNEFKKILKLLEEER